MSRIGNWTRLTDSQIANVCGRDGSSVQDQKYTCDEAECDNLNIFRPPPAKTYVPDVDCVGLDGFPCIDCGTAASSLKLKNDRVNPGYVQDNPATGTYCDPQNGQFGRKGTCLNGLCVNWAPYDCGIVIPNDVMQGPPL